MEDTKELLTVKICPCCKSESEPKKKGYTIADYLGNGVQVDMKNRAMILCDDCYNLYFWKSL